MLQKELNRILALIDAGSGFLTILIGILVLCIFLYFFWGITAYIRKEETSEEMKTKILWGIVGITVITSVWGAIYFLQASIFGPGYNKDGAVDIETIEL